jgi:hypothetical protein
MDGSRIFAALSTTVWWLKLQQYGYSAPVSRIELWEVCKAFVTVIGQWWKLPQKFMSHPCSFLSITAGYFTLEFQAFTRLTTGPTTEKYSDFPTSIGTPQYSTLSNCGCFTPIGNKHPPSRRVEPLIRSGLLESMQIFSKIRLQNYNKSHYCCFPSIRCSFSLDIESKQIFLCWENCKSLMLAKVNPTEAFWVEIEQMF